eukprot:jgi/Orpsp1_1/1186810/evm.model.d7180000053440.1
MGVRRKQINVIKHLIRKSKHNELKEYVDNNSLILRLLENSCSKCKINFLNFAIKNDASLEIIDYIIKECQYETLNSEF